MPCLTDLDHPYSRAILYWVWLSAIDWIDADRIWGCATDFIVRGRLSANWPARISGAACGIEQGRCRRGAHCPWRGWIWICQCLIVPVHTHKRATRSAHSSWLLSLPHTPRSLSIIVACILRGRISSWGSGCKYCISPYHNSLEFPFIFNISIYIIMNKGYTSYMQYICTTIISMYYNYIHLIASSSLLFVGAVCIFANVVPGMGFAGILVQFAVLILQHYLLWWVGLLGRAAAADGLIILLFLLLIVFVIFFLIFFLILFLFVIGVLLFVCKHVLD